MNDDIESAVIMKEYTEQEVFRLLGKKNVPPALCERFSRNMSWLNSGIGNPEYSKNRKTRLLSKKKNTLNVLGGMLDCDDCDVERISRL